MKELFKKYKTIIIIILVTVITILVIKLGFSSNPQDGDEVVYTITSQNSELTGEVRVEDEGKIYIQYSFLLDDDSIKRNGVCIDLEGDWCEDPSTHGPQEIKYRYTANFVSTENSSQINATILQDVYCNQDELRESPFDLNIDLYCGQEILDWDQRETTPTFLIRNGTSFDSLEEFLAINTLNIHDTSLMYRSIYTHDENGSTHSYESKTYEEHVANGPIVKSYDITFTKL